MSHLTPKIVLVSKDGKIFTVEKEVVMKSVVLANIISESLNINEDDQDDDDQIPQDIEIPVSNVDSVTLKLVLQWLEHHVNTDFDGKDKEIGIDENTTVPAWDKNFLQVDDSTLYEIMLAANYLNIKPLLDICCKLVAEKIKQMSYSEIRTQFNITKQFNKEEAEAIKRENEWAVDVI
ncbi:Scskp1-Sccdc4-Cpd peptide complex [Ascoidea rubescens DSM 1968]|uniref:E3 ubiquitin ligase complex SCF subunit n=1 Tax=Ascoidea rubescens DSM 1968 TaxID=1344418 RepID=A0A1D2VAW0_9ASCO|nr:Scskp1-Sccdc4-Cpd peptide complex [Ascoidea rubescens DSM 1968]ODV58725.1 Scskp1-Sccdc4-Cpd peptide complex [Ascoidea rubescens DSM 1968]